MSRFGNWSLRRKFGIPAVILAVIIVAVSWTSYRSISALHDQVALFDLRYFPAISEVLNADRDLYQSLVAQREYLSGMDMTPEQRQQLNQDRIDNFEQALTRGLSAIERMSGLVAEDSADAFRQSMVTWRQHSDAMIDGSLAEENLSLFEQPRSFLDDLGQHIDGLAHIAAVETIETTDRQSLVQLIQVLLIIGIILVGAFGFSRMLVKPIEALRDRMRDIGQGEGDLTVRLNVGSDDELGQVADAFNTVIKKLQDSITVVKDVNGSLGASLVSLRSAASENRDISQQQNDTVDQVVTAVEEMHGAAREIASNSNQGADAATEARQSVELGVNVSRSSNDRVSQLSERLERSSNAVSQLTEEAQNIGEVLGVIRGIAEQTNLLALNAAIEAARAGEHGRGFAVVADEVRALASKTQQSTEDIQNRIENLQRGVENTVEAIQSGTAVLKDTVTDVASAAEAFEQIESAILRISDMSLQIATATEEQSHVVEEINRNLQLIAEFSSRSSDQSLQLSELSDQLKHHTDQLTHVVGGFKV